MSRRFDFVPIVVRYIAPALFYTAVALAILIAGSKLALADTITTGPNGQINWVQSRTFNLNSLLPSICYGSHGSGSGCGESMQQQLTRTESAILSFMGAPAGFNIAGTKYSLSGVQMSMAYSAAFSANLECNGQDLGRDCNVWGTINSFGKFSFTNGPSGDAFNLAQGADVTGSGWGVFGVIPYPKWAYAWDTIDASTSNQTLVNNYGSNLAYFEGHNTLDLTLTKSHTEGIAPGVWQDYNDPITETSNYWSGTIDLQYTFTPVSGDSGAPIATPEPGTLSFLFVGMLGLAGLRQRGINARN